MTKATRKPQIKLGTAKRVAGGGIVVDFIEDVIDNGAPEYTVTGIASIERISAGQVRLAKFSHRKDGDVIVFYEVWDFQTWLRSFVLYERARAIIDRMQPPDGPNDERRRERH